MLLSFCFYYAQSIIGEKEMKTYRFRKKRGDNEVHRASKAGLDWTFQTRQFQIGTLVVWYPLKCSMIGKRERKEKTLTI